MRHILLLLILLQLGCGGTSKDVLVELDTNTYRHITVPDTSLKVGDTILIGRTSQSISDYAYVNLPLPNRDTVVCELSLIVRPAVIVHIPPKNK